MVSSAPQRCTQFHRVWRAAALVGAAVLLLLAASAHAQAAGLSVDASVSTHQTTASSTLTSGAFSTTSSNDLVMAFISSDGPRSGGEIVNSVTGGGLTWKLRSRANGQPGDSEVWEAVAPSSLTNVTVTASRNSGSYSGTINVVAFAGADTTTDGANGSGGGATGAPTATLTATRSGSWVWGVGNDWDNATARTVGSGQTLLDQFLATGTGDTYWVQSRTAAGGTSGSPVTLNDTAPTNDHWNLATVEILPAVVDTQPPTAPANLAGNAVSSSRVSLSWTASTDDVGVTGYDILRNGTIIGGTSGTTYTDSTASPSTSYNYTVEAYDAAGNISQPSNTATVTTPAAPTNPPVISAVSTSGITTTSATVTWTTDIPSSSQVFYGPTSGYGNSTTLDSTQVTSHSQTITGLTAGTTYHFQVRSTGSVSNTSTSPDSTFATQAANITLPDIQIKVPTNTISVAINGTTGARQLQFTHVTWDAGTGPFELDPTYNPTTGTATFEQAIYSSPSPGTWVLDHKVPVPVTGVFDQPSDYRFPLTKFTLNSVNADGSIGSAVATSPKTDYCMTGDRRLGGVPNTPTTAYPPVSNCADPTKPLGFSVGWGDQYDQTDSGQPIDLTGVPDGIYILQAIADPTHVLTESNPNNNVVDTKLQITGQTVTVLSQTNPGATPPLVTLTSPAAGATVSGTATLQATASAVAPATITSVQFLLDGQPLGSPVTSAPYTYNWTIGSTPAGNHTLSAQVTDSSGEVATAPSVAVTVQASGGGGGPDTTPPTVSLTNPTNTQTVFGTTPVAANATDDVAVASVQFYLDGKPFGAAVTTPPYALHWDTTAATNGTHTLYATATDTSGNVGTSATITVTVQNPPPPMTCFVMDVQRSVHGRSTATTASFTTSVPNEEVLAMVSADGPSSVGSQTATVTGAGLTWTLVKRSNGQPGDSEIWAASTTSQIVNGTVTATLATTGYSLDLSVVSEESVKGIGASVAGSGVASAPSLNLTTQGSTSLVFAVGNDWDSSIARTLPTNWTMFDQWLNTSAGDTYWSQYTSIPTPAAGSVIAVNDTAPTTDRWNMVAVELVNSGG